MTSYRGGSLAWEDVAWPQGWFSTSCGMRQIWLRSELQLVSEEYNDDGTLPATAIGLPFLGSATNYYNILQ